MKTANQIFNDEFYFLKDFLGYKTTPARLQEIIISCMEKYAQQHKMNSHDLIKTLDPYTHKAGEIGKELKVIPVDALKSILAIEYP